MCHFITLIAPCADADAVGAVMARHGRAATAVSNPSVARVLKDGECQYLTPRDHCDCGTVLAPPASVQDIEAAHAKEAAKLARKGWSQAIIIALIVLESAVLGAMYGSIRSPASCIPASRRRTHCVQPASSGR